MKKNLALILTFAIFVSLLFCGSVSALSVTSWNFDNGALPTEWAVNATDENVTYSFVESTAGGNALKLSHNGNGSANLKNGSVNYGNGDMIKFSFDIKLDTTASGDLFVPQLRMHNSSTHGWCSLPGICADDTEGSVKCETGKWYKIEYIMNLVEGTTDVYKTGEDGVRTKTVEGSKAISNKIGKKSLYIGAIEISLKGQADITVDNITFAPYGLTLDVPEEHVDGNGDLVATGSIPEGATAAKILVDGVEVANLSVANETFTQTLDTTALSLGKHKVTLSAMVDGLEKTTAKFTTLTGQYTKDHLTGVPATGGSHWSGTASAKNYSGVNLESGYFQHVISGGAIVENKTADFGVNTLKVTGGSGKVYQLRVAPYPYVTKGTVKIELTAKFDTQPTLLSLESKTGSATDPAAGTWPFSTAVDTYIQAYFTEHTFSKDTEYTLGIMANLGTKKWSFVINDEILYTSDVVSGMTSLGEIKFMFTSDAPTMYITDFAYENTLPLSINGMSYYLDGAEKSEAEWDGGVVSNLANAVSLNLSDAPDAASINAQNAKILKDGVAVDIVTPSISGNKVMFTLNEGKKLDAGVKYKIVLSGITFGGVTFAKNIEAEFETALQDAAIYPYEGLAIRQDAGGVLKAAVKDKPENATFKIDGKVAGVATDANADGIYELSYDWENAALGKHTFSVDGTEISVNYELVKNIGTKLEIIHTNSAQDTKVSFIPCEGSDGTEGGAINISGGSQAVNGQLPAEVAGVANTVVMTKFDVYRNSDVEVRLECKSPNGKWINPGFGALIAEDGTVAGSSFKMDTGEWYTVEVVSNFNTKNSTVYVDGEMVKTGYDAYIANGNGLSSLKLISYTTGADYTLDNWYSGLYVENPKVSAAAYKIGEGDYVEASGNKVSAVSDEIKLTMTSAIDAISADKVLVNGVAASAASVSDADIIITPADGAIKANEEIVITLDKSLTSKTYTIGSDTEIRLMANGDAKDSVGEITLTALADGTASATVTVVKGTVSDFKEGEGAKLILCAYDGDKMLKVDIMTITYKTGENVFSVGIDGVGAGKTVKSFLWSNKNITPVKYAEATVPAQ